MSGKYMESLKGVNAANDQIVKGIEQKAHVMQSATPLMDLYTDALIRMNTANEQTTEDVKQQARTMQEATPIFEKYRDVLNGVNDAIERNRQIVAHLALASVPLPPPGPIPPAPGIVPGPLPVDPTAYQPETFEFETIYNNIRPNQESLSWAVSKAMSGYVARKYQEKNNRLVTRRGESRVYAEEEVLDVQKWIDEFEQLHEGA